jgi:hypothetical protein
MRVVACASSERGTRYRLARGAAGRSEPGRFRADTSCGRGEPCGPGRQARSLPPARQPMPATAHDLGQRPPTASLCRTDWLAQVQRNTANPKHATDRQYLHRRGCRARHAGRDRGAGPVAFRDGSRVRTGSAGLAAADVEGGGIMLNGGLWPITSIRLSPSRRVSSGEYVLLLEAA